MLVAYSSCFTISVKSGIPVLGLLTTIAMQYFLFDDKNIARLFACFGAAVFCTACGGTMGWIVSNQARGFVESIGYALVEHFALTAWGAAAALVIIPIEYYYVFHREVVLAKWGILGVFYTVSQLWELEERAQMYVVFFGSMLVSLILERQNIYERYLVLKQRTGSTNLLLIGLALIGYILVRYLQY